MDIILLSKINKLGHPGSRVKVKSGYARNFLIPQGKAILANKKNIESFEAQRLALEKEKINKLIIAKERAEKIKNIQSITILSKAGNKGKIFGSIGSKSIIKELTLLGFKLNKKEIKLPRGTLRTIGEHEVIFQPHLKIFETFIVRIISKN
ncbi:50S ribosomal protein L9 [Buchnera aphidicola]|uniref:50S ribosomal protein L9 n=1 Tax=Buchnera aphidicola TaxID=9 RepID=UPI00346459D1